MTALPFPLFGVAPCNTITDDALVAALRAGDASAVAPFLDRFYCRAVLIAGRYWPSNAPALAWDAVSDLALELLSGRHRRARIWNVSGYVGTAIAHHVSEALRAEKRRDKRHDALRVLEEAKIGQAVSQATYRAAHQGRPFDTIEDISVAVQVPPLLAKERALLTWVADGWTQQSIADALHIERETAKKRIQRLRRRLQATFVA